MDQLGTISPVRLYRMIADRIAEKIDSGAFAAGKRLPAERLLAEQLGVSRASVREALIALELEGYVDVRVGAGVFVLGADQRGRAGQTPRVVHAPPVPAIGPFDLMETRLLLEPEAAARAAHAASEQQLADIERPQQQLMQGPSYRQHDQAFHLAIARACGNAALESAIAHIWELCANNQVFHRLDAHFVGRSDWETAIAEHHAILTALRHRNAEQAGAAMRAHLANILTRLRRDFDAMGHPDGLLPATQKRA